MTLKESTLTLTPAHWIGTVSLIGALIAWAVYVEVQLAEIRAMTVSNKEGVATYVQQNYNDHRGMYVDFKGEIQTLNNKVDQANKNISDLKDMIIQSSRGVRLPQQ
jgi:myo-inositol catabolism protein IolC